MLAEDVRFVDVDESHWRRLLDLVSDDFRHRTRKAILLLIVEGDRIVKAIHSRQGTLKGYATVLTSNLEALAAREKVDVVWVVERGAIPELFGRADARWDPHRPYFDTLFDVARGFTEIYGDRIRRHPPLALPTVPPEHLGHAIEWAIPDDRTYLFYVFSDPKTVWTSLVLRKRKGEVDLVTTHDTLVRDGFAITDWRADVPRLLAAIGRKWGSPFAGLFLDLPMLEQIRAAEKPIHDLIRATQTGEVLLTPYPVRLKMLFRVLRWVT